MLENKWLHLALGLLSWFLWLGLYLSARFGNRDVRQWRTPLVFFALIAAGIGALFWATHHDQISFIVLFNSYAMVFAALWLRRRYPPNNHNSTAHQRVR